MMPSFRTDQTHAMVSNGDMASFGARRDSYPTNEITPMAMEAHTNLSYQSFLLALFGQATLTGGS